MVITDSSDLDHGRKRTRVTSGRVLEMVSWSSFHVGRGCAETAARVCRARHRLLQWKGVVRLQPTVPSLLRQVEPDGDTKEPAIRCRQVVAGKERSVELLDRNAFALEAAAVVRRVVDLECQNRAVPAFLAQPSALDPE